MSNNIYLELELSLDPPITDAAALEVHLKEQIKQWYKQINADPKFKLKAGLAKDYIKNGLRNLQTQANEARAQKLQELRSEITNIKLAGEVEDDDIKKLKNLFKVYFTDATILSEATGTSGTQTSVISFQTPQQPISLKCEKPVSFADMKQIAECLQHVKGGQYQNLYELLGVPQSVAKNVLFAKSKEEADKIQKMPKSNIEADFLNKLAQKFLLLFKDETNRTGYDIALKRFPFDKLCEGKFRTWAGKFKKKGITDWKLYRDSVTETLQLGFTQAEAEWLVYDFYCVKQKCPQPIPEGLPSGSVSIPPPPQPSEFWNRIKQVLSWAKQAVAKIWEQIKNYKPPEQTVIKTTTIYGPTEPPTEPSKPVEFPKPEPLASDKTKFPYSSAQIQPLLNEKRYYEFYTLLLPYQHNLPEKHQKVWDAVSRKVKEADKFYCTIQEKIQEGNIIFAQQGIMKLQQFMPDYKGIEQLRSELKKRNFAIKEAVITVEDLIEHHRYLDAETKLRRFLADHPNNKDYHLLNVIPQIEAGIKQLKSSRSFFFVFAIVFTIVMAVSFGFAAWMWRDMPTESKPENITMLLSDIRSVIANNNEFTPEGIRYINGIAIVGGIGIGVGFLACLCWFAFITELLGILPSNIRRMSICFQLRNTDFGKPKLSKTVWYATLKKEWELVQYQQQLQVPPKPLVIKNSVPSSPQQTQQVPQPTLQQQESVTSGTDIYSVQQQTQQQVSQHKPLIKVSVPLPPKGSVPIPPITKKKR